MGFRVVKPGTEIRAEFHYVNSDYGISAKDGVALVFRPLSPDEVEEFDSRIQAAMKISLNRQRGKGFRDRGDDPRGEGSYSVDPGVQRKVRKDRIKSSLVDWKGFEDDDGEPLPYNWANFMHASSLVPDLLDFADECVEKAYSQAYKDLMESEKNLATGRSSASQRSTPVANATWSQTPGGTSTTTVNRASSTGKRSKKATAESRN